MPDIAPRTFTKLYAIFDNVAQDIFGGIIRCVNHEVARRSFHELLSQKDSPVANHRADYDLIWLFTIDNYGNIDPGQEGPDVIATGKDWLEANKETL